MNKTIKFIRRCQENNRRVEKTEKIRVNYKTQLINGFISHHGINAFDDHWDTILNIVDRLMKEDAIFRVYMHKKLNTEMEKEKKEED